MHLPEDGGNRRCLKQGLVVLETVIEVGAQTGEQGGVMREAVTRGREVVKVVQGAEGARGTEKMLQLGVD